MAKPAALAERVEELVQAIRPILAGEGGQAQGAVLADLVAMYLAGYQPPEAREALLELHVETVRQLIPPNEAIIAARHSKRWPP